jgi:hypothetical protein
VILAELGLQCLEELKTPANVANEPFGESTGQADSTGIRVALARI